MNKKIIAVFLTLTLLATSFCGCKKKKEKDEEKTKIPAVAETTVEILETTEYVPSPAELYIPELNQIQSICELAVLECYYHNVAIGTVQAGTGFVHWGETDKEFWIEYSAYITYGIDFSQVTMDIDETDIVVHVPRATVLGDVRVDESSYSAPIYAPGSFWENDVQIHAEDISAAVDIANAQLLATASSDSGTMRLVESRVEELIENYIAQIMQLSGVDYTLTIEFYDAQVE